MDKFSINIKLEFKKDADNRSEASLYFYKKNFWLKISPQSVVGVIPPPNLFSLNKKKKLFGGEFGMFHPKIK